MFVCLFDFVVYVVPLLSEERRGWEWGGEWRGGETVYPGATTDVTRRATTNATQFVDVTDKFEVSKRFILGLIWAFLGEQLWCKFAQLTLNDIVGHR